MISFVEKTYTLHGNQDTHTQVPIYGTINVEVGVRIARCHMICDCCLKDDKGSKTLQNISKINPCT